MTATFGRLRRWVATRRRMIARLDEQDRELAEVGLARREAEDLVAVYQAAAQHAAGLETVAEHHAGTVRACRKALVQIEATAYSTDDPKLREAVDLLRVALGGTEVPS